MKKNLVLYSHIPLKKMNDLSITFLCLVLLKFQLQTFFCILFNNNFNKTKITLQQCSKYYYLPEF